LIAFRKMFLEGLLFTCLKAGTLLAMITSIVIQGDFNLWFHQSALFRKAEFLIFDVQTSVYPHLFIIGLDGENLARSLVNAHCMIEVLRSEKQWKFIYIHHITCISEEKI
jgi:hypothetical protein